jgi:glutamyl-tRNA synthetase
MAEGIHAAVHALAEGRGIGLGQVAQPIRVAIAGMAISPPIDQTLHLLGRERALARLEAAVRYIRSKS